MREYNEDDRFILELLIPHLEKRLEKEKNGKKESWQYRKITLSGQDRDRLIKEYKLTSREMEIFHALLEGIPIASICNEFCISENTVRKHTTNIYHKMGIHNRWEIIKVFTPDEN